MAEQPISNDARYRARPTIRVDDQENAAVTNRVTSFRAVEHVGGMVSLELRFVAQGDTDRDEASATPFEDERSVALGSRITIYSGDERHPREIFRGLVSAIEADFPENGPAELVVHAEDALQKSRLARRSKVHDDLQVSRLVGDIARELSLTPRVDGFSDSLGVHVQLNESDLAFLRRVLARYDGDVQVVGDELHVAQRVDVRRDDVELALRGQLRKARFVADLAHQVTETTTSGWDVDLGERVSGTSSGLNLRPGTGRTGAQLLSTKLGDRSEHVGHPVVTSAAEAQALADSAFDQRARRFVRLHGTAEGNARIRVGSHVRVRGTSPRFDNAYYVVSACHRFDLDRGYETDFDAESAYLGNP
jgi:phage protein D